MFYLPPIVPPPNWFENPAKSPKMHEKHAKTHKNTWFLATKGDNVWDQNVKKSENMWFVTCGQNLTKKAQKITHFSSIFALFHQKWLFLRSPNRSKAIISQSPKRRFWAENGSKSDYFSLFFRNLFGLSVQYFASNFQKRDDFWDEISTFHLVDLHWKNMFFHQKHQISMLHFVNAPYESAPTFDTLRGWNPGPLKTWDTFCAKMTKTFRFLAKNVQFGKNEKNDDLKATMSAKISKNRATDVSTQRTIFLTLQLCIWDFHPIWPFKEVKKVILSPTWHLLPPSRPF